MFCACSRSSNIYISISTERTEDKSCYGICVQFVFSVHVLCFRYGKKGKQKHATCFETLLQNELKSDVARFTTQVFKPVLQQIRMLQVAKFIAESGA